MKTVVMLGCAFLLSVNGFCAEVGADAPASPRGDWPVEKQHQEATIKKGTSVRIFNHYGDVRVRQMKDERVAAFAIVQTPPVQGVVAPLLMINGETGLVTVGNPTDEFLGEESMIGDAPVARVDLTVFVPEESRVFVETETGLVQVSGVHEPVSVRTVSGTVTLAVSGDIEVHTREGDVDLRLKTCGGGQGVTVETVSGNVAVRFPRPADARVRAQTAGEFQTDFSVSIKQPVSSVTKTLRARICEGRRGPRGFFGRLIRRVIAPVGSARVTVTSAQGNIELYRPAPEWRRAAPEGRH